MKRTLAISLLYLLILTGVAALLTTSQHKPAGDVRSLMGTSNQLYEMEQYKLAAEGYQQLVDQGVSDAALFYNLGNAWYKQGDVGRATLNYLRAQNLSPRDADIRANLKMVRSLRTDQLEESTSSDFLSSLAQFTRNWLSLDELALVALALWYLVSLMGMVFFNYRSATRWREALLYGIVLGGVLFLLAAFSLGSQIWQQRNRPAAVILADEVDVTSGPGEQYVTEFTLHSGSEVNLLESRVSWVRLSLPGGELQGWVPENAVEAIVLP